MYWNRDHPPFPLYGFYRPFFETRTGQIFILCAPKNHIRDGQAAFLVVRQFPFPQYEKITIEPSRPTVQPAENIILVGRASLFIEKDLEALRGTKPLGVGYPKLGQRLEAIAKDCCYEFSGISPRVLVNRVTRATFASLEPDDLGKEVDYGVIRRVFRGASENTLLLEGIHGLGTLGAAKVATQPHFLAEVWKAVAQIGDYDQSLPLEILVRTTFDPSLHQEVYTPEAIEARPLNLVYNRRWIYHMQERCWVDQEPFDILFEVGAENGGPVLKRGAVPVLDPPCMELEADLRRLDPETRRLCRKYLGRMTGIPSPDSPGSDEAQEKLLGRLTASSDHFRLRLHSQAEWGGKRVHLLPNHPSEIRLLRKKFLLHLVLCHLLGTRFRCRDRDIRKHFPEFCRRGRGNGRSLPAHFTSTINGRMREGFKPLLGETEKPKDYVRILHDRRDRSYRLLLQQMRLVVKLRV